jgi:hypothetical protein
MPTPWRPEPNPNAVGIRTLRQTHREWHIEEPEETHGVLVS